MKINITFLYLFFLFIGQSLLSQQITGFVLDSNSGLPIEGASIYFNNTTIGTTTNNSGKFLLDFDIDIKTPLVISFIGYETVILHSFSTTTLIKIYLNESTSVLNEVILSGEDDWSRELKLREFRKNYLGESENGLNCKILNEEDISLRYNIKKKQLTAYASKPILIENKNLKYIITVELEDFKVNYTYVSKNKKKLRIGYVYYSGINFYKSMDNTLSKKIKSRRLEAYYGSPLHFMRALASQNLINEHYKLYLGNIPYKVEKFISLSPIDNEGGVTVHFKDRFSVVYKDYNRSYIECKTSKFYIDNFGNHSPPEAVIFGGYFGKQRMGDALPLDFLLLNK